MIYKKFFFLINLIFSILVFSQKITDANYCTIKNVSLNDRLSKYLCIKFLPNNKYEEVFMTDIGIIISGDYKLQKDFLILKEKEKDSTVFKILKIDNSKLILKTNKKRIVLYRQN